MVSLPFNRKMSNGFHKLYRHEIHSTLGHSFGNQSEDLGTVGKAHKPTRRKCCDYLWPLKIKIPSPAWGVADVRSYGTTVWLSHFFLLLYSLLFHFLFLFSPLLNHWHSFFVILTVILQKKKKKPCPKITSIKMKILSFISAVEGIKSETGDPDITPSNLQYPDIGQPYSSWWKNMTTITIGNKRLSQLSFNSAFKLCCCVYL